jgi:transposase InsO family protein
LPWKGQLVSRALGRFEAESRNACGPGTPCTAPLIDGRRTFLFCFLDDHSRLLCGYRWAAREDVLNASVALRAGIAARGVPKAVYVDNGSPFVSAQLLRATAVLGIRLIHSRPGRPEGRGKIERACGTVWHEFDRIRRRAGLDRESLGRQVRTHDLRHVFVLRTLVGWYREDTDVEAQLPLLSTFLGHVDPSSTYWYFEAAPPLLALAAERLERTWEQR